MKHCNVTLPTKLVYWRIRYTRQPIGRPMPVDRKLLDILCCPTTKVPVRPLSKDQIKQINAAIEQRELKYFDKTVVDTLLKDGLITENGERVYRVDDGIPIMLEDQAIFVKPLDLRI